MNSDREEAATKTRGTDMISGALSLSTHPGHRGKEVDHRPWRTLQLTLFGVGCIIGTRGIFVLTSVGGRRRAWPHYRLHRRRRSASSPRLLCRKSPRDPVAGSAYTYSYTVVGEFLAWTVAGSAARICRRRLGRVGRLVQLFTDTSWPDRGVRIARRAQGGASNPRRPDGRVHPPARPPSSPCS